MRPFRSGGAKLVAAALLAVAAMAGGIAAASAQDSIDVTIDFAKLMKIDRPASTIVIGNPGIFDASIGDDQTIVLTGKAAGTTNMIILDDKGAEITNTLVHVASDTRQLTTVFYGNKRQTFSCTPTCEQVISVGDAAENFTNATAQIQQRQAFSNAQ